MLWKIWLRLHKLFVLPSTDQYFMKLLYTLRNLHFRRQRCAQAACTPVQLGVVATEVALCPEPELEANSTPQQKRLFLTACLQLLLSLLHCLRLLSGKKAPPNLFNNIWKYFLRMGEDMQVLHIRKNTRKKPKLIHGPFIKCRALKKFLSTWT